MNGRHRSCRQPLFNEHDIHADKITHRLDKPFIYVIYGPTTNTIVFMGRVVNP